jgi:hypothetical protein
VTASAVVLVLCAGVLAAYAAERDVSPSRAHSVASSINLRHGDLPTFTEYPNGPGSGNAALATCYGGVPYNEVLADVYSPEFATSGASRTLVDSETEIFPSAALAARDLTAANRPRGWSCLLAAWRAAIAPAFTGQTVTDQVAPLRGSFGSDVPFAVRMTFQVRPKTSTATPHTVAVDDSFTFDDGQAEVGLDVTQSDGTPSASLEQRLIAVLLARTHKTIS